MFNHKETAWLWPASFNIQTSYRTFMNFQSSQTVSGLWSPNTVDDICRVFFFLSVFVFFIFAADVRKEESHMNENQTAGGCLCLPECCQRCVVQQPSAWTFWLAYRPSLLASACSCKLVCNQICVLLRCFFSVNGSHRKYLEELHMIQFVFFFPRDDMELSSMCGTRTWKGKSVVKKLEMQTAAKWRSSFSRLNCR